MLTLLALIVMVADGIVIASIVATLCGLLFGDSPFARLIRLILSIGGGIGYFLLCVTVGWGESDMSMNTGTFIFLFPIGILIILKIIEYMYKNK